MPILAGRGCRCTPRPGLANLQPCAREGDGEDGEDSKPRDCVVCGSAQQVRALLADPKLTAEDRTRLVGRHRRPRTDARRKDERMLGMGSGRCIDS
jgi:hypothetical protein